jgi:Xaa-Pro dipeptidase
MSIAPPKYSAGGDSAVAVPLKLHEINRKRLCKCLKQRHDVPEGAFVILEGGKQETNYSSDTELLFRQESYFHWAFGVLEPDCYGAVEVDTGRSIVFMPELDESYAIWMGKIHPPEHFMKKYAVDEVHFFRDDADDNRVIINCHSH